jgi:hypothetical protein
MKIDFRGVENRATTLFFRLVKLAWRFFTTIHLFAGANIVCPMFPMDALRLAQIFYKLQVRFRFG